MRLIKPYYEIIKQFPGEIGLLKHIETCGRVAWKSEDKITDDSYIKFIKMLKSVKHGSVLEHGTLYLQIPITRDTINDGTLSKYINNKYSKCNEMQYFLHVTTNYRVLVENNWLSDIEYMVNPTEFHEKRFTVRFVCDRGVSHEFVRHRVFSFTQESTRYCNYSKDKFGNELTYIIPCWSDIKEDNIYKEDLIADYDRCNIIGGKESTSIECDYLRGLLESENSYFKLINSGWKPQQARSVLPNSLKTELIMTGFESDWEHFFLLRDSSAAHPQAFELANPLHMDFIAMKQIEAYKNMTKEDMDNELLEIFPEYSSINNDEDDNSDI